MADLLSIADLPEGYEYPPEFVRIVELGLTNLEPWWILDREDLRAFSGIVRSRVPDEPPPA